MGRRRAPEGGTLGRALIRQQVQRSRSHRHTDSWVKTSFSAFLPSCESERCEIYGQGSQGNIPKEMMPK